MYRLFYTYYTPVNGKRMAKKFRKTLSTENCDEFSLSADGPGIDVDDSKAGRIELTIKYPLHTLHVEAKGLREPVEVSARWGSVLAEEAVEAVAVQGLSLAVCGSCRYFLQTGLAAEWSLRSAMVITRGSLHNERGDQSPKSYQQRDQKRTGPTGKTTILITPNDPRSTIRHETGSCGICSQRASRFRSRDARRPSGRRELHPYRPG
jgi:hypothetical protein